MVRELVLLRESSNILEVQKLKNVEDSTYLDGSASVQATILDEAGVAVTGGSWPLSLPYVATSLGFFRAAVPPTLDLVAGQWYEVLLEVTAGTLLSKRRYPIRVVDS